MKVNAAKLAELYDVDPRTVTNWVNSDPPCPSEKKGRERLFETAKVAAWRERRAAAEAIAEAQKQKPTDEADAKLRKLMAEAILAEIAVREKEGELVPRDIVDDVAGQMADRLRAVCINAPSAYALDLERVGIPPETAQEVLEKLADDLVRALRGAVDEPEAELDDAA